MDRRTGKTREDARPKPLLAVGRSLRERFEALPLAEQFRVTAMLAVTLTLCAVLAIAAVWDTRLARAEVLELARTRTASMAERLEANSGGALDPLDGHPQIMAATFKLDDGDVLQRYVRQDLAADPTPPAALGWTTAPTGVLHAIKGYLALEPMYVEHPVQLGSSLTGHVSVVLDHHWVWNHLWHRIVQVPVALVLGCLVAWFAANLLRRQVAEPLAQLVTSTRAPGSHGAPAGAERRKGDRRRNELVDLASNFEALTARLTEYERDMVATRHSSGQQIAERTRDIETRLRRAEALTRSKDEFLANMSHEIRTPMNGVLGMAELLAGTDLDRRQRRFVDSMRAAAETMMQIINDILDDSKIEAGKMDLVLEPFDVRELAEQAGQLYAGPAERKKLEMICRIEPTVPSVVVGDVLRLRQVLGNLLSNAVKYTDRGEVEIRVGLDDSRDNQCRIHFSIRDTGPGIPDPEHSGVFEPFTQLENGSRTGGTGLGLSIATRLVKLMGGTRIDLASEMGRGSTFSFVLPFEIRESAAMPDKASDEFSGLRVLVVDDNPTTYMLLEEMLANWSAEVTVVNRGKSAPDRLQNAALRGKPFDVVVLDHSLPDATTEELLRVIRLDPALAHAYVVLLSALDFDAQYEGTRVIAPDVCIGKPVRQQLMRNALRASRQPRVAPVVAAPATEDARPPVERTLKANLGLHVMVVDDNAINREVSLAMLEELGCSVVLAEDGRPAVANAQHDRFDVVFMDCQMPGMDGYTATETIRREESQRGQQPVPIIALTANVMSRDRNRCEAAGMSGFLAKPFKAAQLLEVLQPIAVARGTFKPAPPVAEAPAAQRVPAPSQAPGAAPLAPPPAAEPARVADTLAPVPAEMLAEALFPETPEPPVALAPVSRLPVLDLEQVQSIRGLGKPQVFERLCEMLYASSKDAFARLDAALAEGKLEEVAAAAHALKSPVSNLGGRRLADLLERCETAALEGADIAVVRRSAAGIKAHYAALVAALQAENKRDTGTG